MTPAAQDWHGVQLRGDEAARLMGVAFREFKHYPLFKPNDVVGQAVVWQGAQNTVPVMVKEPLGVTMQADSRPGLKVALVYDGPVPAPIEKGQKVGELKVTAPDYPGLKVPVYAAEPVSRANIFARMYMGIKTLLFGRSG
jgi:D-alanyl-D-alanine carboxypeptidase (penicillin-binding protein 5/6)